MDPISLAVGAALLVAGFLAGRFRRPNRTPKEPTYQCTCKHYLSDHDPQTGVCHGTNQQKVYQDGTFRHFDTVPCTCRNYVGPKPLELTYLSMPPLPPRSDT